MSHESSSFDEAILTELDAALDSAMARLTADTAPTGRAEATRKLWVFTSMDLLRRRCRLRVTQSNIAVKEKYRIIADGVSEVLSAWGDAPPQFAKFCVPEDVYEKLYPLYAKALDRATRPE